MRHLISLLDYDAKAVTEIFRIADEIEQGKYRSFLSGKTAVAFFPDASLRTRVSFEKGVAQLGGQFLLFPPETLNKRESLQDVVGYLNNWADLLIVRHPQHALVEELSRHAAMPVINAMTDANHPCEILSDLYALSKLRADFARANYLFCGADGNIGRTWRDASRILGFPLEQCCGAGYELEGVPAKHCIEDAVIGKDVVCTDSLPSGAKDAFRGCQVTLSAMQNANPGALLNPCPPFFRGEEVSADAIDSPFFVGYAFKSCLLQVQQAVMIYCLSRS